MNIVEEVANLKIAADAGKVAAQRLDDMEQYLDGLRSGMMGEGAPETDTQLRDDGRRQGARLRRIARMDLEGFRAGVLGETYGAGSDPEFVRGYEEGRKAVAALTKPADEVETYAAKSPKSDTILNDYIGPHNLRVESINRSDLVSEPTHWRSVSVVPWGCVDARDWQTAEQVTFRLEDAKTVHVGAAAVAVVGDDFGGCEVAVFVDGKLSALMRKRGSTLSGGVLADLGAGWHRVALCARGSLRLVECSVGAAVERDA